MPFVERIALAAVSPFFCFGAMTGRASRLADLEAPATTGHDGFERMYRVQMHTLETLVALFLAGKYGPARLVEGLGAVYVVSRFVHWRAYVTKPAFRGLGCIISMVPTLALLDLALVGMVRSGL